MAKPQRPWTVFRPGPLERIDDNLWCVEDDVVGGPGIRRRMVIARRGDGKLVFYNAIPVPDDTLAAIRRVGDPAYLVCPNAFHCMDAPAFREKLGLRAFGPTQSIDAVRSCVDASPVDDLPGDPAMTVSSVDGFRSGETILLWRTGPRVTLIVADLFLNQPHGRGVPGFFLRVIGFTGPHPKLPRLVKARIVSDGPAVAAKLRSLADTPGLSRLVPSHGSIVTDDPAGALRRVAATV